MHTELTTHGIKQVHWSHMYLAVVGLHLCAGNYVLLRFTITLGFGLVSQASDGVRRLAAVERLEPAQQAMQPQV
jgi:hypothetical protein